MNPMVLHESSRGFDAYTEESSLFRHRMIFFNDEVNSDSCKALIESLLHLDMEMPGEEILILLNSPGGSVIDGLAVYDTMQTLKSPVKCIVAGIAASMGSIIFCGAKERLMLTHSKLLIHEPFRAGISGTKHALELEKEAAELMEYRQILAGIIAKHSGRTLQEVLDKTKEDCLMNAKQAIEFGIATGVCKEFY